MYVSESLESILKPKSKEEIRISKESLDVEEKEKVLFNIGMAHFGGSYDDFFEFLETELKDTGFWMSLIDLICSGNEFYDDYGNIEHIDEKWIKNHVSAEDLTGLSLSMLSEESIDIVLGKLIPGYLLEAMNDVLKPKSEEEINININKRLKIKELQRKLEKHKGLFCLYIFESGWNINIYLTNIDVIMQEYIDYASEALRGNFFRTLIIYKLNPQEITDNSEGRFSNERTGSYSSGAVKIISELIIKDSNNIEIEL